MAMDYDEDSKTPKEDNEDLDGFSIEGDDKEEDEKEDFEDEEKYLE